jgi:hypothetical protein
MVSSFSLPGMIMFNIPEVVIVGLMLFTIASIVGLNDWAVRRSPPAISIKAYPVRTGTRH